MQKSLAETNLHHFLTNINYFMSKITLKSTLSTRKLISAPANYTVSNSFQSYPASKLIVRSRIITTRSAMSSFEMKIF